MYKPFFCPFETHQPEINESRCTIPLDMPIIVTDGKSETWYCIYRGKYEECPVVAAMLKK